MEARPSSGCGATLVAVIGSVWGLLLVYYTYVFVATSNYDSYGCEPERDVWFVVLAAAGGSSAVGALIATSRRPRAVWALLGAEALVSGVWFARGGFAAYDCALGI